MPRSPSSSSKSSDSADRDRFNHHVLRIVEHVFSLNPAENEHDFDRFHHDIYHALATTSADGLMRALHSPILANQLRSLISATIHRNGRNIASGIIDLEFYGDLLHDLQRLVQLSAPAPLAAGRLPAAVDTFEQCLSSLASSLDVLDGLFDDIARDANRSSSSSDPTPPSSALDRRTNSGSVTSNSGPQTSEPVSEYSHPSTGTSPTTDSAPSACILPSSTATGIRRDPGRRGRGRPLSSTTDSSSTNVGRGRGPISDDSSRGRGWQHRLGVGRGARDCAPQVADPSVDGSGGAAASINDESAGVLQAPADVEITGQFDDLDSTLGEGRAPSSSPNFPNNNF